MGEGGKPTAPSAGSERHAHPRAGWLAVPPSATPRMHHPSVRCRPLTVVVVPRKVRAYAIAEGCVGGATNGAHARLALLGGAAGDPAGATCEGR